MASAGEPTPPGPAPDAQREREDAAIWLDHARWAWEKERVIYDGLGQRAVAFLSLNGVLLVLLANADTKISGAARGFMFGAIWTALASAVLALFATLPQRANSSPVGGLRERWRTNHHSIEGTNLADEFTEMLLMTEGLAGGGEVGPVAELRGAARSRGLLTMLSGVGTTAAIALVVLALAVRG